MQRFSDRHALVTGAGSGIGLAIAKRLASEGATVGLLDLDGARAEEALAEIAGAGGRGYARALDVADAAAVGDCVAAVCDEHGEVGILVNNAGIAHIGDVGSTTPEDMQRVFAVNVHGVYHCLHAVVPRMAAGEGGAVVNMCSVAAKQGIHERFSYSASKGAVLSMTLSVARDYIDRRVRCNCVCPARVHTPFVDGYLAANYPGREAEVFAELSAYQPIGRMGEPGEIAALVAFLCSDEAAFITGSAYDIDGGATLLR
jgi:NAD(P)-dependent dehydrogenase (short-subunit alcohol dehydrogenase family)